MASLNKVQIIGNLTRDPEIKYTGKGTAVGELGIAVNRKFKGGDGNIQEETTFIDVVLWGKTAEIAGEYLKKGASVYIEGRLQLDTWDDKQTGQKRSKLRIVGEEMQFLGGKPSGRSESREDNQPRQERRQASRSVPQEEDGEDIPF